MVEDQYFSFVWDQPGVHTHFAVGGLGYANHSSQPNVEVERDIANSRFVTKALCDINVGEEITHCYIDKEFVKFIEGGGT